MCKPIPVSPRLARDSAPLYRGHHPRTRGFSSAHALVLLPLSRDLSLDRLLFSQLSLKPSPGPLAMFTDWYSR